MRTLVALLGGAALIFPSVALTAHEDSGPPAAQVAAQICTNLQQQLGAAFSGRYGSLDQCEQTEATTAQTIVDGCTSKAQPGTDVYRQCVQSGIAQAVQQVTGNTTGPIAVAPSATEVSEDICDDLHTALGTTFSAAFGTLGKCETKLIATARTVISGCVSKAQPGTAAFKQCMESSIHAAVQVQRKAIAKQLCANLQRKLGVRAFAKKYGSLARCQLKKAGGG